MSIPDRNFLPRRRTPALALPGEHAEKNQVKLSDLYSLAQSVANLQGFAIMLPYPLLTLIFVLPSFLRKKSLLLALSL
jgi:hypothetical protein